MNLFWRITAWPFALVLYGYARLVMITARVRVEGYAPASAVYVMWHTHLPLLIPEHGANRRWMLVSRSPHMASIVRYCQLFGLRMIRGSSGDRGREAFEDLAALVRAGASAVIAVDGPAGPIYRVKRGCAELALATGVPIVPVSYRARRGIHLPRWDRGLLPTPFDDIIITYGQALAPQGEVSELLASVQQVMDGVVP